MKVVFKLYITGKTPRSMRTIECLKDICENDLRWADYEILVIDVLENPQRAEDEKILATPMLIKESPPPTRRVIGDLSDKEQILFGLDLLFSGTEVKEGNEGNNDGQ
jgi:circadian clock protein KaiB